MLYISSQSFFTSASRQHTAIHPNTKHPVKQASPWVPPALCSYVSHPGLGPPGPGRLGDCRRSPWQRVCVFDCVTMLPRFLIPSHHPSRRQLHSLDHLTSTPPARRRYLLALYIMLFSSWSWASPRSLPTHCPHPTMFIVILIPIGIQSVAMPSWAPICMTLTKKKRDRKELTA